MIENGVKVNPPSDELVARLEMALGLPAGELVRLAHWQTTPPTIRRQVEALESQRRAAVAQLRELVGGSGKPDAPLDELWRTGKLQRLIERLGGDEAGVDGHKGGARPPRTPAGNAWSQPLNAAMPLEVPLINSVAAGYPTDFSDLGYPARVADSYVRSPDVHDPDAFACRVVGDSMMPEYREGDIVVFSPARAVVSGADCFVRLEPDHDTTFKRVFFEGEDGREVAAASVRAAAGVPAPDTPVTHLRLQPLNGKYPARVVAREGVSGLYVAVSVTRKL
jgi:SOS-response transcriptional repressor LexA